MRRVRVGLGDGLDLSTTGIDASQIPSASDAAAMLQNPGAAAASFANTFNTNAANIASLPANLQAQVGNLSAQAQQLVAANMTQAAWQAKQTQAMEGFQSLLSGKSPTYSQITSAIAIGASAVASPVVGAAIGVGLNLAAQIWPEVQAFLDSVFNPPAEAPPPTGTMCVGWYAGPQGKTIGGVTFQGGDYIQTSQVPWGYGDPSWKTFPFTPAHYFLWVPADNQASNGYWASYTSFLKDHLPYPGASIASAPPTTNYVYPLALEAFPGAAELTVGPLYDAALANFQTPLFPYDVYYKTGIGITANLASFLPGDLGVMYRNIPFLWKGMSDVYFYGDALPFHWPGPFLQFFVHALMTNAENWYNCQPHADARTILKACAFVWNATHADTTTITLRAPETGNDLGTDLNPKVSVAELVLGGMGDTTGGDLRSPPLLIHTGPLRGFPPPKAAPASSGVSTGTVVVTGAALGTAALWWAARRSGRTMGAVLRGLIARENPIAGPVTLPVRGAHWAVTVNRAGWAEVWRRGDREPVKRFWPTPAQRRTLASGRGHLRVHPEQFA